MNLSYFFSQELYDSGRKFFEQELGIRLAQTAVTNIPPKDLLGNYLTGKDAYLFDEIKEAYLIGRVDEKSLNGASPELINLDTEVKKETGSYSGILVFAVRLKSKTPTRSEIAKLTRALNRRAKDKPVILLTLSDEFLSYSTADRIAYKQAWREGEQVGKITMLKDIQPDKIHPGHQRILWDMKFNPLEVDSFDKLYDHWKSVFSVQILNKNFYQELFHWYLWAKKLIQIPPAPKDEEQDEENLTSIFTIRLLTRLLFVWFVKEKKLIPSSIFQRDYLNDLLISFDPLDKKNGTYYKAILQNLFFATLNTPMKNDTKSDDERRQFLNPDQRKSTRDYNEHYLDQTKFRYKELLKNPEDLLTTLSSVPFLNGGLFECLDYREGNSEKRFDGFSSTPKKQALVPDVLFFGKDESVDLSKDFDGDVKMKRIRVRGIIDILNSYKFTVTENTPLEEEIALDPELLGKVFENLLASYNPETKVTARNMTGSFYTPREIVSYMVDQSLKEYLLQILQDIPSAYNEIGKSQTDMFGNAARKGQLKMEKAVIEKRSVEEVKMFEQKLAILFEYGNEENPFSADETKVLIEAISNCKILDPACGSGAFPMGVLHRMVHLLSKLDRNNIEWKKAQLKKAENDLTLAKKMSDEEIQRRAVESAKQRIKYIEESFSSPHHELDYTRKLFLIENCIYGVDIQQIAIQIAKLRFFISLMSEQKTDDARPNRNILSMPNLETKFVAANTLIPLEKPQQQLSLLDMNPDIKRTEDELRNIRSKIFFTRKYSEKKELHKEEKECRSKLLKVLTEHNYKKSVAEQMASWNPFDQLHHANFFDAESMFELVPNESGDGIFNIVIGNPPYIQLQDNKGFLANQVKHLNYATFDRRGDIYCVFYERGLQLLKKGGYLMYITSNKWMRTAYGAATRKFFAESTNPMILLDFAGQQVFDSATVDTNILLLRKDRNRGETKSCIVADKKNLEHLDKYVDAHQFKCIFKTSESWVILNPVEQRIKEKIDKVGKPLKDWDIKIYRGVLTGLNEAFIIDGSKKDELIKKDPKSAEIIRPILRGRDIKRYGFDFADLWLIATLPSRNYNIEKFPAIKKHLLTYGMDRLKQSGEPGARKKTNNKWFETQDSINYWEDFFRPKIVWKRIGSIIRFCYDEKGTMVLDSTCFATGKRLKFLVALLNSPMGHYLLKDSPKTGTGDLLISVQAIEPVRVPDVSAEVAKEFDSLVNEVIKRQKKAQDFSELEKKINAKVFDLYGLDEGERRFISKMTAHGSSMN